MLAALIALAWVVLQVAGRGNDKPNASPTPTSPTTAPAVAPTAPLVDGIVDVSLVSSSRGCDPQRIRVTPTVNPGQFTKAPVAVGLVISSTERTACTLVPADADLLVVISANKTAIWDSTVCKTSLLTAPVALSPGWSSLVTTAWSGRGSGVGCAKNEGYATPGTYVLQAGTLGGEPGKTTFTLDPAPKPKATPTPTATPSPTPKKK